VVNQSPVWVSQEEVMSLFLRGLSARGAPTGTIQRLPVATATAATTATAKPGPPQAKVKAVSAAKLLYYDDLNRLRLQID